MTDDERFVEIQVSAEKRPFSAEEFGKMERMAGQGIKTIIEMQKEIISQLRLR